MEELTVDELFDYLLKDKAAHTKALLQSISDGKLLPTAINSELLAKNKAVNEEVNPDTELDHIDAVLGDPNEPGYDVDAIFEQIDNDTLANKLLDNAKQTALVDGIKDIMKNKYDDTADASTNLSDVRLDRMLSNIRKNDKLTDNEKKEMALRLVYNYNTRQFATEPEDIKLDQDDIFYNLDWAGLIDDYKLLDPSFMSKERIQSDQVPMTYISDKTNGESLFTPSKQSLAIYNMFTNALTQAIKAGNAPAVSDLRKYIRDTYMNKLKTLSYMDWMKIIDAEEDAINKAKEQKLGRPLKESEKVVLDIDDNVLTPEDWVEFVPDNPKGYVNKTQAEKADNRLNRWHSEDKEAYKEYLAEMAESREPGSFVAETDETVVPLVAASIRDFIDRQSPILLKQLEEANAKGYKNKEQQLKDRLNYYRAVRSGQTLQIDSDHTIDGMYELKSWIQRYISDTHRNAYGIDDRIPTDDERQLNRLNSREEIREARENMQDDNLPAWARDAYTQVDKQMKAAKEHAKQVANTKYNSVPESLLNTIRSTEER